MTLINKAVLKHLPSGKTQNLSLFRIEQNVYRWVDDLTGKPCDGVDYLDISMAIKALRVRVETEPNMTGIDLMVLPVAPPPEERAARRIARLYTFALLKALPLSSEDVAEIDPGGAVDEVAEIIRNETGIDFLIEHTQTLLAFLFQRRLAYAKALFPTVQGQEPRDITLDGLLLQVIEAMQKATGQDYANLVKILKEPISTVKVVSALPPGAKIQ